MQNEQDAGSIFATTGFWQSWREECRQIANGTAVPVQQYDVPKTVFYVQSSEWTAKQLQAAANALRRGCSIAIAAHNAGHAARSLRHMISKSGGQEKFILEYMAA